MTKNRKEVFHVANLKSKKEMDEELKSHEKWNMKHQLKWGLIVGGIMAVVAIIIYFVMMSYVGF